MTNLYHARPQWLAEAHAALDAAVAAASGWSAAIGIRGDLAHTLQAPAAGGRRAHPTVRCSDRRTTSRRTGWRCLTRTPPRRSRLSITARALGNGAALTCSDRGSEEPGGRATGRHTARVERYVRHLRAAGAAAPGKAGACRVHHLAGRLRQHGGRGALRRRRRGDGRRVAPARVPRRKGAVDARASSPRGQPLHVAAGRARPVRPRTGRPRRAARGRSSPAGRRRACPAPPRRWGAQQSEKTFRFRRYPEG